MRDREPTAAPKRVAHDTKAREESGFRFDVFTFMIVISLVCILRLGRIDRRREKPEHRI